MRSANQNRDYQIELDNPHLPPPSVTHAGRARRAAHRIILAAAAAGSAASFAAQSPTVTISRVNIVDTVTGGIAANRTVTIQGTAITSVTESKPSNGTSVVDGQGKFLIPGLWDMHTHMEAVGEAWLPLSVANGVTSIRDMGSDLDLILKMREATASGWVLGPRVFAAGPILDDAPGDWPFRMRVTTGADGRAAVQQLKRRGVDLIKVHNHTPRDAFFAIADEAGRQKLPLAGHVPMKVSTEEAVEAGQTGIEHLSESQLWIRCSGGEQYQPEKCRPLFELLARRKVWQTPTLVASELVTIGTPRSRVSAEHYAYAGRSLRELWAGLQKAFVNPELLRIFTARAQVAPTVTRDLWKAGVDILAGCDTMIAGFWSTTSWR